MNRSSRRKLKVIEQRNDESNPYIDKRVFSYIFVSDHLAYHKQLEKYGNPKINLIEIKTDKTKKLTFMKHNHITPRKLHKKLQKNLKIQESEYKLYSRHFSDSKPIKKDKISKQIQENDHELLLPFGEQITTKLEIFQEMKNKIENQNQIIEQAKKNIQKIILKEQERINRLENLIS